ncbi:MAG: hypothetical protein KJ550_02545 [Proteobacteria bacterium]|nr:hypothetical protein [Desulfobacteraceae bacterium]MBU3981861.1 hypothetical protein [Pseudomonadota bacterium]MBU4012326.1 hypothetical protein [Pseudomonadota bacterium]MBU4068787.1 hypothetical protein [Pseudomonadota bacterium]MBU4100859.1 hypothetical protein [Pseudomonadota bacterium]
MTMHVKHFKQNMLVYGSDVYNWPEGVREAGLKALDRSPELQALLADEECFEKVLKMRKYEEPGIDLSGRIISATQHIKKKERSNPGGFFSELLREFSLPKPAFTAVFVSLIFALIVGFAMSFSNPSWHVSAEQYKTNLEEFLYYEGEVL